MENQNQLSLLTLLPNGKVENDVRIGDKMITGICTVFISRSDSENEFLLREIGVAPFDGNNLTEAVDVAVNHAYTAAISRIAGANSTPTQQPVQKNAQVSVLKTATEPQTAEETPVQPPAPVSVDNDDAEPAFDSAAENSRPPVDLGSIVDLPGASGDDSERETWPPFAGEDKPAPGGIERIEFGEGLFPASDLLKGSENGGGNTDDDGDTEYKDALNMEITIFGKLHDCNGWTAGKILAEKPDVIVDFCHRNSESANGPKYTGPRTDQKEALFRLYPDAVRKVEKVA